MFVCCQNIAKFDVVLDFFQSLTDIEGIPLMPILFNRRGELYDNSFLRYNKIFDDCFIA